ncbi:hypothetical protein HK104_005867, partial [Borealophlyctis nickersoniae]
MSSLSSPPSEGSSKEIPITTVEDHPTPRQDTKIPIRLIPYSETPAKFIGEPVERVLKDGHPVRIGRQVVKEGQHVNPPPKHGISAAKGGEQDVWFVSKVVSRNHAEMWAKDGLVYIKDIGSSSGTFLNKMRLSPSGKESRPYPLKDGDLLQFGVDFKGKPEDVYKCVLLQFQFQDQTPRKKVNPQ